MLPNVLVVGAQKCGTTALYRRFAAHPECSVSEGHKETNFFIAEGPWPIGSWHRGVDWYSSLFADARVAADVCPGYSADPVYPGVARRAREVVPDALVVYLVRDPIERMVSHWIHWRSRGYDRRPFAEAVLDPAPGNEYVLGSSYGHQLGIWIECFGAEQVIVMEQAQVDDPGAPVWRRLGLEPPVAQGRWNISGELTEPTALGRLPAIGGRLPRRLAARPVRRPVVDDDVRAALHDRLAGDIRRFHELTAVRLAGWPGG